MVGPAGPGRLSPGREIAAVVRWRWEQQRDHVSVQGGPPEASDSAGYRDSRGPLPALLLEAQSDRASAVPAFDPSLSRSDLPDVGDRSVLHGQGRDDHRTEGQGEHSRQGLRHRPEICRGIQEDHEDRFRQDLAQMELSGYPRARVKSGSYWRPIPKTRSHQSPLYHQEINTVGIAQKVKDLML